MSQAKSLSLSQFTTAVQTAVKAATQKHPQIKLDLPQGITLSYLIRGFPVPEAMLSNVTFAETQKFADEVAVQIAAQPEIGAQLAAKPGTAGGGKGAIYSAGGHIIIGIPAVDHFTLEK
jgi:hypothetical protein